MFSGDENIKQHSKCGCAVKCQQLILRDYGFDISEDDLYRIGKENGWYDEAVGVFMRDNGKLLGCFGVEYHHLQHNTIDDIVRELQSGHRVMVNVNADKMHDGPTVLYRNNVATHAVLINDVDQGIDMVDVTDPMNGRKGLFPLEWFVYAWQDSVCYMLATDRPVVKN